MPWLYRVVPGLASLRRYDLPTARADLLAGLTVAAVAVPQAMAYGMVAGLDPQIGLYTAIVMTAVGAVLDSSRQLINGPTNAISIAVLSAIASIESPEARLQAAVLMAFLVGCVQLGISFLRLGDLTRYISHSVIVGFTAGAGTLLVLDQVKHLLGLRSMGGVHDHFLVRFFLTLRDGGAVHGPTLALGLGSIAATVGLKLLKRRLGWLLLPDLLLVVIAAAALTAGLGLDAQGVKVIGEVPAELPPFAVPAFDLPMMRELLPSAFAIGTLGLLEAIAMAKAIAAHTRQKLDLNQQCLSEGLANFSGSFFHCMPGSGSLTRSAINHQAGARTQWSGVVSAGAVAATMVAFGPYAQYIPKACLAGILMVSAWYMVDWRAFLYHVRATRFDAIIVAATAVSAFAISVEFCVLIGLFLSFGLAVPRVGQLLLTEFVVTGTGAIHERLANDTVCDRILIFGLEGELFFGAVQSLETHLQTIEDRIGPRTQVVVLRLKRARNPDAVGLHLLDDFIHRVEARGVQVLLCGVRDALYDAIRRSRVDRHLQPGHLFREQPVRQASTLLAMRHAYSLITEPCAQCPRRADPVRQPELYFLW